MSVDYRSTAADDLDDGLDYQVEDFQDGGAELVAFSGSDEDLKPRTTETRSKKRKIRQKSEKIAHKVSKIKKIPSNIILGC